MAIHTVVNAAVNSTRHQQQQQQQQALASTHEHWPSPSSHLRQIHEEEEQPIHTRQTSYGTTSSSSTGSRLISPVKGSPDAGGNEGDEESEGGDQYVELEVFEPVIDVTWKYLSRMYLLVPVFTALVFTALVLLVTFAWPPSRREREGGQSYPHPILPWPFLTGLFASVTVQSLRVPVWVVASWLPLSSGLLTLVSTVVHTILHETLRLATLPMIRPSPTSGFHSSFYLALGWGAAEVVWGIVQGWDQLSLYEDVMRPEESKVVGLGLEESGTIGPQAIMETADGAQGPSSDSEEEIDEAELERRVEILERMRARRDLEQVIGLPFPNIPFPFHLLWRLDTLLLNLGLTLILSAYYFNSYPIYRHDPYPIIYPSPEHLTTLSKAPRPGHNPSPYMWLVWGMVVVLHVTLSLVWKIVGRVGIGAVTWGGLIVSLGSVFAGLGGWGGLV